MVMTFLSKFRSFCRVISLVGCHESPKVVNECRRPIRFVKEPPEDNTETLDLLLHAVGVRSQHKYRHRVQQMNLNPNAAKHEVIPILHVAVRFAVTILLGTVSSPTSSKLCCLLLERSQESCISSRTSVSFRLEPPAPLEYCSP